MPLERSLKIVTMEYELLELSADKGLKKRFKTARESARDSKLASFWIKVKVEYCEFTKIALKYLLFPSNLSDRFLNHKCHSDKIQEFSGYSFYDSIN